jgi:hypothetical protein
MKLAKSDADLREAQEQLSKPRPKPAPEESKHQMIA